MARNMAGKLVSFSQEERNNLVSKREGETKLGERVSTALDVTSDEANFQFSEKTQFVLFGIKEDIGIRGNLGKAGAIECWEFALKAFLNVQSNQFLDGEEVAVLGHLEFPELLKEAENLDSSKKEDLQHLREMTAEIDDSVSEIVEKITAAGKIPIIIGGGHNNAFGNIKGVSRALKSAISVLNIDPHTDFRAMEGRHSGNGFRYARDCGFLEKYAVFGLSESYNSENILNEFQKDKNLTFSSFESLLPQNFEEKDRTFKNILNWFGAERIGLELDLDSVTNFPVSALNPSGFSLNEIRHFIRTAAALRKPHYFHICEGSPGRAASEKEKELLGKNIAFLITDFIKSSQ